jgi:hypothetical protein
LLPLSLADAPDALGRLAALLAGLLPNTSPPALVIVALPLLCTSVQ